MKMLGFGQEELIRTFNRNSKNNGLNVISEQANSTKLLLKIVYHKELISKFLITLLNTNQQPLPITPHPKTQDSNPQTLCEKVINEYTIDQCNSTIF